MNVYPHDPLTADRIKEARAVVRGEGRILFHKYAKTSLIPPKTH